jgi:WD40 repeat protein
VILFALAVLLAAPDVVLESGHGANISALVFSPDGKFIVSGSEDSTLKLWDPNSGVELRTLRGHTNIVTAVALNPDGSQIASASLDHTLRLWNAATGQCLRAFRGPVPAVYLLKISPDSASFITAETVAAGSILRIWDIKSGKQTRAIKRDDAAVSQIFFNGNTLLVAEESGEDDSTGSLSSYDWPTGRFLQTRPALLCGASDDGKWIALDRSTGRARRALIVNLPDDKPVAALIGQVSRIVFSKKGDWFAYESLAGDTAIVKPTLGGPSRLIHGRGAEFSMMALSPDGRWLATSGADFSLHIWDVASGKLAHATSGQYTPTVMAFSPDGRRIAVNGGGTDLGSAVRVWDIAHKAQVSGPVIKKAAVGMAYSRDGGYLAVSSALSSPSLEVFDLHTNEGIGKFDCGVAAVLSPVFSPNGKWLAANCSGVVTGWPFAGRGEAFRFGEATDVANGPLAFSPDNRFVAAGSTAGLALYDLAQRRIVQIARTTDPLTALAFSADGEFLACGTRSSLFLLNLHTWRKVWTGNVTQSVTALKFTRDARGLLAATDSLTLYEAANGHPLRILIAKLPNGSTPAFSTEGDWFSVGVNSAAHLWHIHPN